MKKLLFSVFILLIGVNLHAQLHVRGNNFVFANDVQLFVKNEVHLVNEDSNLYLRNNAQLIQEDDIGNRGLGELSVRQTGTVNRYAYNYWCSPVGGSTTASNNEIFRVELIDEPTGLSSSIDVEFTPALNSEEAPLRISDRWLFTFVNATDYTQWNYVGSDGAIAPGLGFTMKGVGTAATGSQEYDFRGKPNNGTITNTVATDAFTIIGNPYPSALDAALFVNDPANISTISGELYFWEQQVGAASHFLADYIGGYATLTFDSAFVESFTFATFSTYDGSGNPVAVPPGPGGMKRAKRFQPIGQGFLVRGLTNGTVTISNQHRAFVQEGPDSFFFRNADVVTPKNDNPFYQVPEDYKRFRINIDFNDLYTRQLLHNFHNTATDGFDRGLEGHRPSGPDSDAYWILDDEKFVIQAHNYNESLRIPLIVHAETNQPLRFRIVDVQNFENQQPIYIYDSSYDVYVNLKEQDYNINIESGTYSNRFEITFNRGTLSNDEFITSEFRVVQDNQNAILLLMNPTLLDIQSFKLVDIAGKEIIIAKQLGIEAQYNFNTSKLSDGVYIASIESASGNTLIKKIIVKN